MGFVEGSLVVGDDVGVSDGLRDGAAEGWNVGFSEVGEGVVGDVDAVG